MSGDSINTKQGLTNWSLKLQDTVVSYEEPWEDDALEREKTARALTNLINNEPNPLVISLSGNWGTGKTFLLKRWQVDLEKEGFKTIYFNAWEDDFCDEPFIAMIGQLEDFLRKNKFSNIGSKIVKIAGSLVKQSILSILYQKTGIKIELESLSDQFIAEYKKQRETKEKLKKALKAMSTVIVEKTNHPLIFIIDELDRCRPTFAIELLERVKHIFDVPNMFFVFGINRSELCSSIRSIYGEIDTMVYMRRFFDMEFFLPTPNAKSFCEYAMGKYQLEDLFKELSKQYEHEIHHNEYRTFKEYFSTFCSPFDLSLRDLDYCIRSILFVGKSIDAGHRMFPFLVSALIILRLKKRSLYLEFVQGKCLGKDIVDYFDEIHVSEEPYDQFNKFVDILEVELYSTKNDKGKPKQQLSQLINNLTMQEDVGKNLLENPQLFENLSKRTQQKSDFERVQKLCTLMTSQDHVERSFEPISVQYLFSLIELTGGEKNR